MPFKHPVIAPLAPKLSSSLREELNQRFFALAHGIRDLFSVVKGVVGAYGSGRVVGDNLEVNKPTVGTGHTIHLMSGARYIVEGQLCEINDPAGFSILSGVPANKPNGVYGYLSIANNGSLEVKPENWFDTPQPHLGLPSVGRVITDPLAVVSIDDSAADKVQSHASVLKRIKALEARPVGGGGGGEPGGGGGDVTQAELDAVQSELDATKDALAQLRADFTAFETGLEEDNVISVVNESEIAQANQLRMAGVMVETNAQTAKHVYMSMDVPGVTGNGEDWGNGESAPVVYVGGNVIRDPETRSIR